MQNSQHTAREDEGGGTTRAIKNRGNCVPRAGAVKRERLQKDTNMHLEGLLGSRREKGFDKGEREREGSSKKEETRKPIHLHAAGVLTIALQVLAAAAFVRTEQSIASAALVHRKRQHCASTAVAMEVLQTHQGTRTESQHQPAMGRGGDKRGFQPG